MSYAQGEQVGTVDEHGHEGGRGINWWGMIFFIASEALIFANFIAAYLYLEIRNGNWQLPSSMVRLTGTSSTRFRLAGAVAFMDFRRSRNSSVPRPSFRRGCRAVRQTWAHG